MASARDPVRLRLRPEQSALWTALAVGAIGAAALAYNANAAWLVLCLVLAVMGIGAVAALRRVRALVLAPAAPASLVAGEPGRLALHLDTPLPIPGLVLLAGSAATAIDGHPAGVRRAEIDLPPLPRGVHRTQVLRAASTWPLGVLRAEAVHVLHCELVVTPRPRGVPLTVPEADGATGGGQGGLPEDFAGHRPYQAGDPVRGIDWRAAARGMGLLSTRWDGRGGGTVTLRWDAAGGDDERRLGQLARWLDEAHALGLRYTLALPGRTLGPGAGDAFRARCLRALAAWPEPA